MIEDNNKNMRYIIHTEDEQKNSYLKDFLLDNEIRHYEVLKGEKLNTTNIAEVLLDVTIDTTDIYFQDGQKKNIDKQLWAFLHIGFIAGMKINGYTEKEMTEALKLTQQKLQAVMN